MSEKAVVTPQRTVLIFQGGGALGAFQAGAYEALHRAELNADWVVGTSIGAINAALIVGNRPERRLEHLYEFWARMGRGCCFDPSGAATAAGWMQWNALVTMLFGTPHFFAPRWGPGFALGLPVAPGAAGLYDATALRKTLDELIDFDYLNDSPVRLSVGAVDVESGQLNYFDSREQRIGLEHIMASGALPPAFPPVEIDGRYYWDGGIHSNTPLECVLRDRPRRHTLCFMATLWPLRGEPPASFPDVLRRSKELQYASRAETLIELERELHRLRHGISLLASRLPATERTDAQLAPAIAHGCRSVYHLVRLQAPRLADEDQTKDIDFAPSRIAQRWSAGCQGALQALAARPWERAIGPEEGVLLHSFGDPATAAEHSEC